MKVLCTHCQAVNRISEPDSGAVCERCRKQLFSGRVLTLGDESFRRHLRNDEAPLLVDFWAPGCAPCRRMAGVIEQLARDLSPELRCGKLNVDEYPRLAQAQAVRAVPCLILFRSGREIGRYNGVHNARQLGQWARRQILNTINSTGKHHGRRKPVSRRQRN